MKRGKRICNTLKDVRIQFTNGSVTEYVYSATGQKLGVEYRVAAPNVTVPFGAEPDALTQGQVMYDGSTQHLLGGSLVVKDGLTDRYLFDGGYAKALFVSPTTYSFEFHYYNKDHLGNIREVVDSSGTVKQVTNYYPFGAPYADPAAVLNANMQPYKYNFSIEREKRKLACSSEREKNRPKVNNKELDRMHGLDTYDYGARQYAPVLGRWDRMDPLCEKYYDISPYAYCGDNPVMFLDPNGCDSIFAQNGNFIGDDGKNTEPTVLHRNDGSVIVSHGITPFVVNGEEARLGTPVVSWHIHTKIDKPIGNGETAKLVSSNPSSDDYVLEQSQNTGSTFVVGQRDQAVQYYHNGKNTISLSWKQWKKLSGLSR